MGHFLLTVTVVLVLVAAPAIGLRCYVCSDISGGDGNICTKSNLESNKDKYLFYCPSTSNLCMRTWEKTKSTTGISNGCSNQLLCDSTKSACDVLEDNLDDYDCAVSCCDTDACNAGSVVSISVYLLTVFSILGLALMI